MFDTVVVVAQVKLQVFRACGEGSSAVMKLFFERRREASFVSNSCRVKMAGECQKEAKTRVEKNRNNFRIQGPLQALILELQVDTCCC